MAKPTTKELLKARIEKLPPEHLELVDRVLAAFEVPAPQSARASDSSAGEAWTAFIRQTYGSMADDPIDRQPEGLLEVRAPLE